MNHTDNIMDQIVVNGIQPEDLSVINEEVEDKVCITRINETEEGKSINQEVQKKSQSHIWNVFKKIQPMPILVWLIYVQTFMVFPGLALQKNIVGVNVAWGSTLLVLTYNVGDFMGKYLCSFRSYYNKVSTTAMILGRFIFYISFIVILTVPNGQVINTDWFAFVNMFLFALSNGYATSAVMVLGPEQMSTKDEKETTGFIMNNGLYLGMMCGAFLALTFKNIGK